MRFPSPTEAPCKIKSFRWFIFPQRYEHSMVYRSRLKKWRTPLYDIETPVQEYICKHCGVVDVAINGYKHPLSSKDGDLNMLLKGK